MRGLTRKLLVLGMAALPVLCHAQISPLADSTMGNVTGQAGLTIELQTKIHIDQFKYTDQGSFSINNIDIGGANTNSFFPELGVSDLAGTNPGPNLDNIKLNIDMTSSGDAIINMLPISFSAVDFKITTGQWDLQGTAGTTELISNFNMVGLLGSGTIRVLNAQNKLSVRLGFAVSDLDFDMPIVGFGIRNMQITGECYNAPGAACGNFGAGTYGSPQLLDLFSDNTFYIYKATSSMPNSGHTGMDVNIPSFKASMTIGQVLMGGQSIGSLDIYQFELHNTNLVVYGH